VVLRADYAHSLAGLLLLRGVERKQLPACPANGLTVARWAMLPGGEWSIALA